MRAHLHRQSLSHSYFAFRTALLVLSFSHPLHSMLSESMGHAIAETPTLVVRALLYIVRASPSFLHQSINHSYHTFHHRDRYVEATARLHSQSNGNLHSVANSTLVTYISVVCRCRGHRGCRGCCGRCSSLGRHGRRGRRGHRGCRGCRGCRGRHSRCSRYSCRGCLGWPGCHSHRSRLDSTKQILPSSSHRTDSIVQILLCQFYRADFIVQSRFPRAGSLVQILSRRFYHAGFMSGSYRADFFYGFHCVCGFRRA